MSIAPKAGLGQTPGNNKELPDLDNLDNVLEAMFLTEVKLQELPPLNDSDVHRIAVPEVSATYLNDLAEKMLEFGKETLSDGMISSVYLVNQAASRFLEAGLSYAVDKVYNEGVNNKSLDDSFMLEMYKRFLEVVADARGEERPNLKQVKSEFKGVETLAIKLLGYGPRVTECFGCKTRTRFYRDIRGDAALSEDVIKKYGEKVAKFKKIPNSEELKFEGLSVCAVYSCMHNHQVAVSYRSDLCVLNAFEKECSESEFEKLEPEPIRQDNASGRNSVKLSYLT